MSSITEQNSAALAYLIQLPVSRDMIKYLARKASEVIQCEPAIQSQEKCLPPTPPITPPNCETHQKSLPSDPSLPSVEAFITALVQHSHVQVHTLMPSLIYLARLKARLPPVAKGMKCTVHRIFLAALILAAKNLNDSSPKNKYWARYTSVPGFEQFGFSTSEVNLMERQLLFLLDWDLRITNDDLYIQLEPFLAPIREYQQRQLAAEYHARIQRERAAAAAQQQMVCFQGGVRELRRSNRMISDSTASSRSSSTDSYGRPYPTRSTSRLPSRTPSLSPPGRSDECSSYANSLASNSPAYQYNNTPSRDDRLLNDAIHIRSASSTSQLQTSAYVAPPMVSQKSYSHLAEQYTQVLSPNDTTRPTKRSNNIFSKNWWSNTMNTVTATV